MWLMFFLLLRVVLRKPLLAAGVFVVFYTVLFTLGTGDHAITWMKNALWETIILLAVLRCGLTAGVVLVCTGLLLTFPVSADLSAWYVRSGLYSMVVVIALAGYGFVTSLGGRPLFGKGWLGEE
jgi:hypothetical protein